MLEILPWLLLASGLWIIRWSKGAGFADVYAFLTKPFWPGPAQKEWIQAGVQVEQQARLKLLEEDNQRLRGMLSLKTSSKSSKEDGEDELKLF